MPGIIAFQRRWSVGSDDLVVPGLFLFFIHLIWLVILVLILALVEFNHQQECASLLWQHIIGYLIVIVASLLLELMISLAALRGSILDTEKRKAIPSLVYIRLIVLVFEIIWLLTGGVWISRYYRDCPVPTAKEAVLGLNICSWLVILTFFITLWCTFDPAGRSWVKMMNYQRSMKASESKLQYRRSGSCTRTWRQRKVLRAYQNSWDQRCRLLFCCMRHSDRSQNSFGDIARLLSDFFRDIDVVPSDVVAGLILLRKYQKIERESIVKQRLNDTYEYLSGVAVTSDTQFLPLNDPVYYAFFQDVIHYMTFALGAYGWPMYVMNNPSAVVCELCANLRCSCFPCCRSSKSSKATIIKDNCCQCNYAALKQQVETQDVEIVYATFHVDVGITPFFVAIDYSRKKIIVSIRGTLSLQDVITDLNAEGEPIPINPPREDWLGHKGMIQVAVHIQNKLIEDSILSQAFNYNPQRGTQDFKIVVVGHSLGAGSAAILSILLRQHYPDVICFSYSPPGGTLSMPAAEYTKSFITSVVVGKDVVPRIGLHQMESLRADLMHAIKRSKDPKWKTISCSFICCGCAGLPTSAQELKADDSLQVEYTKDKSKAREFVFHSQTSNVALTSHQPLYPPGRIIHVVRHHTTRQEQRYESKWRQVLRKRKPVYQALWANNTDFDEVLISPVMIQDHMPDNVLEALNKVVQNHTKETDRLMMKKHQQKCPDYVKEFEKAFFCKPQTKRDSNVSVSIETSDEGESEVTIMLGNKLKNDEGQNDLPKNSRFGNGRILGDTRKKSRANNYFQVITTVGPRKPQRTAAFFNAAIESENLIDSENSHLLSSYLNQSSKPNTPAHRLQLETSFTSLLSPNEKLTYKISLQSFGSHSSNNTNTITTNSLIKNESCFKQIKPEVHTPPSKAFIPWEYQSMLDDQNFDKCNGNVKDDMKNHKIDLIHDDWLGLAPLATPESLSEVSSISSRASSVIIHHERSNSSIKERRLSSNGHKRKNSNGFKLVRELEHDRSLKFPLRCKNYENSDSSDSYLDSPPLCRNPINLKTIPSIDSRKSSSGESNFLNYGINSPEHEIQMHRTQQSPRVIRRTLKIPKGLSTAYEDSYSNQRFEEMMKCHLESHENTSNETNSFTSAKSQDLEKSSTDLYLTPVSGSREILRNEEFSTPEKILENSKLEQKDRFLPKVISCQRKSNTLKLFDEKEDINYHKPTMVILPTDENFPCNVSKGESFNYQYPYLETDFSLSDPDLTICDESNDKKFEKKIKFSERVKSGVSFDQDYEFDIETESTRLLESSNDSGMSFCRIKSLQAQDSCYRDEDSLEETPKNEDCLFFKDETKSSQNLLRVSLSKKSDNNKSHFSSKSAEALPLLASIGQECLDKKRKYSFSFLTVNKGESSV